MNLHVSSTCAHHQEIKIALHSLWYHHTYRWPSRTQVVAETATYRCDDTPIGVMIHSLWYHHTYRWPSRTQVVAETATYRCDDTPIGVMIHSLWYHHTYRCDDTRGGVMQF